MREIRIDGKYILDVNANVIQWREHNSQNKVTLIQQPDMLRNVYFISGNGWLSINDEAYYNETRTGDYDASQGFKFEALNYFIRGGSAGDNLILNQYETNVANAESLHAEHAPVASAQAVNAQNANVNGGSGGDTVQNGVMGGIQSVITGTHVYEGDGDFDETGHANINLGVPWNNGKHSLTRLEFRFNEGMYSNINNFHAEKEFLLGQTRISSSSGNAIIRTRRRPNFSYTTCICRYEVISYV